MPISKKEKKVAGLEKYRQLQRAKEMKRKQRKKILLPTWHAKVEKWSIRQHEGRNSLSLLS